MRPRLAFLLLLALPLPLTAEPPQATDPRLTVELVAREPEILTPTAVDVDAKGRVWVLENNTHFRPKDYAGPPTDRILVFEDFGPDGHARKQTVFADGFRDGMGLKLLPDGGVIVSTRSETFRLRDTAGTGRADERTSLLELDTKTTYPHDGLNGIALDGFGHLFVGLGENFGAGWTLAGTDGTSISGADEGGIFRCNLAGGELQRWAIGLWNPFGLAFDHAGRLFALDNDPGAGSFCRLLHIVHGGDFGYRFRYGRTIDHPFLSWFGQIPGTLPSICLVGEAPTGIIEYHGANLPAEYVNQLFGCTWNDHGIQRFPLEKKGSSFTTKPEWLIRGGNDFRPTGIAQAPDGSLFITDWVESSYELHGKGRLWHVRAKEPASSAPAKPAAVSDESMTSVILEGGSAAGLLDRALAQLKDADPYQYHGAIDALVHEKAFDVMAAHVADPEPRVRLGVLLASRRSHAPDGPSHLPKWLADPDGNVRRAALQWISEEHLDDLRRQLEAVLAPPLTRTTFEAYLAALQMMTSGKPDPKATIKQTREVALDKSHPADLRALALRLLPAEESSISAAQLKELLNDKDDDVRNEALHILAARHDDVSQAALRQIATDPAGGPEFRADAIAGLTFSAGSPDTDAVLRDAAGSASPVVRSEALRALRGHLSPEDFQAMLKRASGSDEASRELREQLLLQTRRSPALQSFAAEQSLASIAAAHPAPTQPWPTVLEGEGDPAAGRRVFYHPNGPRCYTCHTIEGRGGSVGPDLTKISQLTPAELLTAIREPSKDIAPAFTNWLLTLEDGRTVSGIDAFEDDKTGVHLIDATGKRTRYDVANIVSREPLPVSMMPPGLDLMVTEQEMRDLLAFLRVSRE